MVAIKQVAYSKHI